MYWCSLKMQFLWMSRSKKCNFLGGSPSMGFPVWKYEQKVTFKTRLMEAFLNNPNVDGWGARKCKSQFCQPPHPHVHGHNIPWPIPVLGCTTWMHNSVDSVNVVPQHETCHGVGWKRESLVRAIQGPWKPITFFVSIFCWLLYYGNTMLTVNRSNQ